MILKNYCSKMMKKVLRLWQVPTWTHILSLSKGTFLLYKVSTHKLHRKTTCQINETGIFGSNKMFSHHSRSKPYKNQNILSDLDIKCDIDLWKAVKICLFSFVFLCNYLMDTLQFNWNTTIVLVQFYFVFR